MNSSQKKNLNKTNEQLKMIVLAINKYFEIFKKFKDEKWIEDFSKLLKKINDLSESHINLQKKINNLENLPINEKMEVTESLVNETELLNNLQNEIKIFFGK